MNDLLHIVKDDAPQQYGHQQQHPRQQQQRHPQQQRYQQQQYEQQQYHDQNDYGHDVEEGRNGWDSPTHQGTSDDMQQFFAKTKEIQAYMNEIRHRQHDLWQMHEQSKTLVRRQDILPHRQRMQVGVAVCQAVKGGNFARTALQPVDFGPLLWRNSIQHRMLATHHTQLRTYDTDVCKNERADLVGGPVACKHTRPHLVTPASRVPLCLLWCWCWWWCSGVDGDVCAPAGDCERGQHSRTPRQE